VLPVSIRRDDETTRPYSIETSRLRMYYRSGTGGRGCICAGHMPRLHSPGGSTSVWNDVMAAILKVWRQIENGRTNKSKKKMMMIS